MEQFDIVVFGGGKAGKTLAMDQAKAGKNVALIERKYLGGSCINVACIPSKTLIASARRYHAGESADRALSRTGQVVSEMIAFNRQLFDASGLHLIWGDGRFTGPRTIEVITENGTRQMTAERIYVNLGTVAAIPEIEGLTLASPATHVEALSWTRVPEHLIVLGGGYIALELSQAFRRLGAQVTILVRGPRVLGREDPDIADLIAGLLADDGITLRFGVKVTCVDGRSGESVQIRLDDGASVEGSHLLVATGRVPMTAGVGLDLAGIRVGATGFIEVNERLETSAAGVWALGECAGSPQFTHASLDDYRVAKSGLSGGQRTTAGRLIPSALFLDPEFARIGLSETEARAAGIAYRLAALPVSVVPRAWTLGERRGLLKALVGPDDQILGFSMLGPSAGEVVSVVQMAMLGKLPYMALRDGILAHPTMAEGLNMLFANLR